MFSKTSPRSSRDKNKNKESEDIYLSEEIEDPQDSPTVKRLKKRHLVVTTDSENEYNDESTCQIFQIIRENAHDVFGVVNASACLHLVRACTANYISKD